MATRKTAAKGKTAKAISGPVGPASLDHASLTEALQTLMQSLAALSVARGMSFAAAQELLKQAFVEAARRAHPDAAANRMVSRVSTVTGLHRREVSRLMQAGNAETPARPKRLSPATQVFTRWLGEPSLRTEKGKPLPLPRQGPAPSFEELAKSVNRDVHARSLLEELRRLGLVRIDGNMVHVVQDRFVPKADTDRMLGFLGSNVGDHLRAAVANVLSDPPKHLEQAVFADELSQASLDDLNKVVRGQWQALLQATVPLLHQLIEADKTAGRALNQRVRIGLYTYSEPLTAPTGKSAAERPTRSRKSGNKPGSGK
jgi:hypothetical protein